MELSIFKCRFFSFLSLFCICPLNNFLQFSLSKFNNAIVEHSSVIQENIVYYEKYS